MILNTTYTSKEHKQLIADKVGKAYSFFQAIKRKGVGSKRLIIDDVSPNLTNVLNTVADINYANIELRPKGILVHINKGLQTFTWVIPFYQLVLYKANGSSIHAQGRYIHFKANQTFKENKNFLDKLLDEKVKFDERYNFQYTR
ncbi:MAG: hypothetical protein KJO41_11885 [Bacteroidia bacterium]|nr:hypothetical protein [Bacteroidia bacterium]NND25502.1 hypothetical protein [Flavobacteriaceae bacterium]MBT8279694.1 hypothetical protein [Bacteroidia bacterium]NNK60983.1 hypothetical protein [Flavobacteriaceae bacterium]NNL32540.1 hypothetical protein [Flavobacteriaceae bacterium]